MLREPEEVVAKGAELVQGVAEGASDSDIEIKLYYLILYYIIVWYSILEYRVYYIIFFSIIFYYSRVYYSIS